jgi:hypothetical protein
MCNFRTELTPSIGRGNLSADEFRNSWNKFRDALRREDQLMLDEMFRAPDIHLEAVNAMGGTSEFVAMAMAMLIEQEKINDQIDDRLAEIEERVGRIERK